MHAQNLLAPLDVRVAHHHLSIEPAWAEQSGIEDVVAVGGADDDGALRLRKAVHLDEELVQCLFTLFVTERVAAAISAHGIELVDEDDARLVAPRLLEQLADA